MAGHTVSSALSVPLHTVSPSSLCSVHVALYRESGLYFAFIWQLMLACPKCYLIRNVEFKCPIAEWLVCSWLQKLVLFAARALWISVEYGRWAFEAFPTKYKSWFSSQSIESFCDASFFVVALFMMLSMHIKIACQNPIYCGLCWGLKDWVVCFNHGSNLSVKFSLPFKVIA